MNDASRAPEARDSHKILEVSSILTLAISQYSSVVEHFLGMEVVESSNLSVGSGGRQGFESAL